VTIATKGRINFLLFSFCALLLLAGIAGCGYDPTGDVNQIQLAIYTRDCVDVLDASTASGAQMQLYPCGAGKMSQEWSIKPVNNGTQYQIVNANSKMCMSVASDPDTAPGQFVVQYACVNDDSQPDQLWTIVKAPSGEAGSRFVSVASGQCLDLPYGAVASIFTLQQYTCDSNDPAQGWTVNPVSKGNTP
jgi:Ricin-type beta-trefoil lectin domain